MLWLILLVGCFCVITMNFICLLLHFGFVEFLFMLVLVCCWYLFCYLVFLIVLISLLFYLFCLGFRFYEVVFL